MTDKIGNMEEIKGIPEGSIASQRQKSLIPLQKKPYALCVVLKPKNLLIHKLLMA